MKESFKKKLTLFFNKFNLSNEEQEILGIDIGSSSIKVVQLKKEKERAVLQTYGELLTGAYADKVAGQSVQLSLEKTIEAIKDLLRESNVKTRKAVISIPLKSSFITTINLPLVKASQMEEIIRIEARRYIPVPISEIVLDWKVIPKEEVIENELSEASEGESKEGKSHEGKKSEIEVLLVAIHKDIVEKYGSIVKGANLLLKTFEIEIFSIARSCIGREIAPILVFDFGASAVKIAIVDHGMVRLVHTINKGSQDLTLAISHAFGIDFTKAEDMKKKEGLSAGSGEQSLANVIKPMVEYIFSETNKIILGYQKKYSRSIDKIVLTGGGSLLNGFVDEVSKNFNTEVVLSNPFLKTEYPAFLDLSLKNAGPSFGTALGLALDGLS